MVATFSELQAHRQSFFNRKASTIESVYCPLRGVNGDPGLKAGDADS